MKVSVIIPAYNEYQTIEKIINKVIQTKLNLQIIVIDDFSSDGTRDVLLKKCKHLIDELILHNKNLGKGAAIKSAQKNALIKVFRENKIPFREFEIKEFNEKTLGELFSFFILETAILGKMLGVNPFDQPAVENVKRKTKSLLN